MLLKKEQTFTLQVRRRQQLKNSKNDFFFEFHVKFTSSISKKSDCFKSLIQDFPIVWKSWQSKIEFLRYCEICIES